MTGAATASSCDRENELAAKNIRFKRQLAGQAEALARLQKAMAQFTARLTSRRKHFYSRQA
ncbi:hypothetical protein [Citrobacter sedlakii]|uniref:hypothetical protein n=1 Tax=Citrobacter sedlakii TaxID=67826 RepID=UPI001BA5D295|nr:hypothetical protein [Citrobacter sedlakii]EKJ8218688.1 hypothetical protein [Citrobacter sedlakii]QUC30934.1 hypothetical protein JY391_03965 [Citrobacter sedlakii]HBU8850333.1 hypothetical protein [Citrobacter sedlakii]HCA7078710.1 hypothetical protein [Citrobacter sedlakii]